MGSDKLAFFSIPHNRVCLFEVKPDVYTTYDDSLLEVPDMTHFPYNIKNVYRRKTPVVSMKEECYGEVILVKSKDGSTTYFDNILIDYVKETGGELFLSTKNIDGNHLLFVKGNDFRIAVAGLDWNKVNEWIKDGGIIT